MGSILEHLGGEIRKLIIKEVGRAVYENYQEAFGDIIQSLGNTFFTQNNPQQAALTHDGSLLEYSNSYSDSTNALDNLPDIVQNFAEVVQRPDHPVHAGIKRLFFRNKNANLKRKLAKEKTEKAKKQKEMEEDEPETMEEAEPEQTTPEPELQNTSTSGGGSGAGNTIGKESIRMTPMRCMGNKATFRVQRRIPVSFTNDKSDTEWSYFGGPTDYKVEGTDTKKLNQYLQKWHSHMHIVPDKLMNLYMNHDHRTKYFSYADAIKFNYCKWTIKDLTFYQRRYIGDLQKYDLVPAINQQLVYLYDNDGSLTHTGYMQVFDPEDALWNEVYEYESALSRTLKLDHDNEFNNKPMFIPKWITTAFTGANPEDETTNNQFLAKFDTTVAQINNTGSILMVPSIHKMCHYVSAAECEGKLHAYYAINTPWLKVGTADRMQVWEAYQANDQNYSSVLLNNGIFPQNGSELTITQLMNNPDSYSIMPDPQRGSAPVTKSRGNTNLLFRGKNIFDQDISTQSNPVWINAVLETEMSISVAYDDTFNTTMYRPLQCLNATDSSHVPVWQAKNWINLRGRGVSRVLNANYINRGGGFLGEYYRNKCKNGETDITQPLPKSFVAMPYIIKNNNIPAGGYPAGRSTYMYSTRSTGINLRSGRVLKPADKDVKSSKSKEK